MASAQVVETSVTNNSPSQDSNHPDDHFQSRYVTTGFKPFSQYWSNLTVSIPSLILYIHVLRNFLRILWYFLSSRDQVISKETTSWRGAKQLACISFMEKVCHWPLIFCYRRFGSCLSLHQWYENKICCHTLFKVMWREASTRDHVIHAHAMPL